MQTHDTVISQDIYLNLIGESQKTITKDKLIELTTNKGLKNYSLNEIEKIAHDKTNVVLVRFFNKDEYHWFEVPKKDTNTISYKDCSAGLFYYNNEFYVKTNTTHQTAYNIQTGEVFTCLNAYVKPVKDTITQYPEDYYRVSDIEKVIKDELDDIETMEKEDDENDITFNIKQQHWRTEAHIIFKAIKQLPMYELWRNKGEKK